MLVLTVGADEDGCPLLESVECVDPEPESSDAEIAEREWGELGGGFFLSDEELELVRAGTGVVVRGRLRYLTHDSCDFGQDYDVEWVEEPKTQA
jgi:hypothetical protein